MQRHMFPSLPFFLWGWVGVHVAIITSRHTSRRYITARLGLYKKKCGADEIYDRPQGVSGTNADDEEPFSLVET